MRLTLSRALALQSFLLLALAATLPPLLAADADSPQRKSFAISPLDYSPDEVADYIKRQQAAFVSTTEEMRQIGKLEGNAFREYRAKQKAPLTNIVKSLSLVQKSPWTPREVIEFRRLLSRSTNGVLNHDTLQMQFPSGMGQWNDEIRGALYSFLSWGSMSSSPPLVSVKTNTPAEIADKLLELRTRYSELRVPFERITPRVAPFGASTQQARPRRANRSPAQAKTASASYPPDYWEAVVVGEEITRIFKDLGKNARSTWTRKQLEEFLGKMRGESERDFAEIFDASDKHGPIFEDELREALEKQAAMVLTQTPPATPK